MFAVAVIICDCPMCIQYAGTENDEQRRRKDAKCDNVNHSLKNSINP